MSINNAQTRMPTPDSKGVGVVCIQTGSRAVAGLEGLAMAARFGGERDGKNRIRKTPGGGAAQVAYSLLSHLGVFSDPSCGFGQSGGRVAQATLGRVSHRNRNRLVLRGIGLGNPMLGEQPAALPVGLLRRPDAPSA
jgi:hypothetical protein